MGDTLSISSVAIARHSGADQPASSAVQVSAPDADSRAVRAWERDSLSAHDLAYFQTAAWARAAGEYDRAIGRTPVLLSCREPNGAGFSLPLSIGRERGCKVARALGEQLAEYTDVVGESVTAEGLRAGFAALRRNYGVDLVALRRVPNGTALDLALNGIGATAESPQVAPWVPLGPGGPLPNTNGGLPAAYRDGRRRRKKLNSEANCTFEVHRAGAATGELMQLALSWKKEWVKERGLVSRVGTEALDRTIISLMHTEGLGSAMGVLRIDAEPVAVASGFVCRERFYCHVLAYRPDAKDRSAGRVVVIHMVEWCGSQGLSVYDFGPPADQFKLEWTDHVLPVANRLVPLSLFGRGGQLLEGTLKPLARSITGRLPVPLRKRMLRLSRYTQ